MGGIGGDGELSMYTEKHVREKLGSTEVGQTLGELEPSNMELADLSYADGLDRNAAPVIDKIVTKPHGIKRQEDLRETMESLGAIHPGVFEKLGTGTYISSSGPRYDKETKQMLEDGNYRQALERWNLR